MIKHILMANFKPEISQPERDEFGKNRERVMLWQVGLWKSMARLAMRRPCLLISMTKPL